MFVKKAHINLDCINRTTRLYTHSSFISGFATIFNIAGNYYEFNYSNSPDEADFRAIEADWNVTAKDFRKAVELLRSKYNLHVDSSNKPKQRELTTDITE